MAFFSSIPFREEAIGEEERKADSKSRWQEDAIVITKIDKLYYDIFVVCQFEYVVVSNIFTVN